MLTVEDQRVLLRALGRGMASVNTIMPMIRDDADDAIIMGERTLARAVEREYEEEMRERDAADHQDWLAMNGLVDDTRAYEHVDNLDLDDSDIPF
jgi:hypothetical protein